MLAAPPQGFLATSLAPSAVDGATLQVTSGKASVNLANANTWTAPQTFNAGAAISPTSSSSVGLVVKGLASQTGDLLELQNSSGTVLAKVDASGNVTAAGTGYFEGQTLGLGDASTLFQKKVGYFPFVYNSGLAIGNGATSPGTGTALYLDAFTSGSAPIWGGWTALASLGANQLQLAPQGSVKTQFNTLDDGTGVISPRKQISGQPGASLFLQQLGLPANITATVGTSGSVGSYLAANTTYYYTVTAVAPDGSETNAPAAVSAAEGATPYPITISWSAVTNAASYNVYKGTSASAVNLLASVTGTSYPDTGNTATTSQTPPTSNNTSRISGVSFISTNSAGGGPYIPYTYGNAAWGDDDAHYMGGDGSGNLTFYTGWSNHNQGFKFVTATAQGTALYVDGHGNMFPLGKIAGISGIATAGNYGVATTASAPYETELTTTSATTVASFTPPANGMYRVSVYWRVVTATTTVTISVGYSDAGGAQTYYLVNGASQPVGSYEADVTLECTTASAITVTATAATANQVYVSATIEGVA